MTKEEENKIEVEVTSEFETDTEAWWFNWKSNIVDDPNAPKLYSRMAILGFYVQLTKLQINNADYAMD